MKYTNDNGNVRLTMEPVPAGTKMYKAYDNYVGSWEVDASGENAIIKTPPSEFYFTKIGHPLAGTRFRGVIERLAASTTGTKEVHVGDHAVAIGKNARANDHGIAIGIDAIAQAGEVVIAPGSYVEAGVVIGGYTFNGSENPNV